jgi:hypothetical protein
METGTAREFRRTCETRACPPFAELLAESFAVVIAFLGDFGFLKTAMTAAFCLDFYRLGNEPACCRFGWHAMHLVEVVQCDGGFQDAVEALFLHAQIHEGLGMFPKDGCQLSGGMDFRVTRVDLAFGVVVSKCKHAVFEGAHAVKTPLSVDDGLGELAFREGLGSEIEKKIFGEALIGCEVLTIGEVKRRRYPG